jgi:hypothetical protein
MLTPYSLLPIPERVLNPDEFMKTEYVSCEKGKFRWAAGIIKCLKKRKLC